MIIHTRCPHCGSTEVKRMERTHWYSGDRYVTLRCNNHFCRRTSYAAMPAERLIADHAKANGPTDRPTDAPRSPIDVPSQSPQGPGKHWVIPPRDQSTYGRRDGIRPCHWCEGTGKFPSGRDCPSCHGRGTD